MKLHLISAAKAKRIHRSLNSLKLTLVCGFLTLLVLRGTLGAGKFGTPAKDFEEIKLQFERVHFNRKQLNFASRVLNEVKIEKKPTIALVQNGAETAQNDVKADRNEGNPIPNAVKRPQNDVRFPQFDHDVKLVQEQMVGKPYSLGPKISDWDSKRMVESELSRQDKKAQIMLITGSQPSPCENPAGDNFLLKSMKNKQDYGRLHGIEIFYNMANLDDDQMSGFWGKLPLLRKMMVTHPNVDWFWWMDSDALFTDMAFEVPMERYENYNLVLHGWGDMVYKDKNRVGLNTGSFLLRNCHWSLDLLDAWATVLGPEGETRETGEKRLPETLSDRPDNFEADDQSALVSLLVTHRDTWGEKVFLENSYYLHGYWPTLVHTYEDLMKTSHNGFGDDRWPFVTHFVGCKPCKNTVGDSGIDSTVCFEQMQRAFNFADNQVLELYGFRHQSLSTDKVQHIDDRLIASSDI